MSTLWLHLMQGIAHCCHLRLAMCRRIHASTSINYVRALTSFCGWTLHNSIRWCSPHPCFCCRESGTSVLLFRVRSQSVQECLESRLQFSVAGTQLCVESAAQSARSIPKYGSNYEQEREGRACKYCVEDCQGCCHVG